MTELVTAMKILFQYSFNENQVPNGWLRANITASFKKGDRSYPGNYRPVSLTSVICKVMEAIVREEIIKHMKKFRYFSKKQFVFLDGVSTPLQLIKVVN